VRESQGEDRFAEDMAMRLPPAQLAITGEILAGERQFHGTNSDVTILTGERGRLPIRVCKLILCLACKVGRRGGVLVGFRPQNGVSLVSVCCCKLNSAPACNRRRLEGTRRLVPRPRAISARNQQPDTHTTGHSWVSKQTPGVGLAQTGEGGSISSLVYIFLHQSYQGDVS
jgi:hypothetical protein